MRVSTSRRTMSGDVEVSLSYDIGKREDGVVDLLVPGPMTVREARKFAGDILAELEPLNETAETVEALERMGIRMSAFD